MLPQPSNFFNCAILAARAAFVCPISFNISLKTYFSGTRLNSYDTLERENQCVDRPNYVTIASKMYWSVARQKGKSLEGCGSTLPTLENHENGQRRTVEPSDFMMLREFHD